MPGDRALIGYLADYVSARGSFYGGILVVNEKGLPREFRHTDGLNPSRIQRTLYGDSLLPSIGTDALGPSLWRALSKTPTIVLIDPQGRPTFGEFALSNRPAALITAAPDAEAMFADQIGPSGDLVDHVQLTHFGVANSYVFAYVKEGERRDGVAALHIAQDAMNLKSPFDRVRAVLAQVAEIEEAKGRK